jgi:hypothetical protein
MDILCCNKSSALDTLVNAFNVGVRAVLDRHAPEQTKSRSIRPRFPWYDEKIRDQRRVRRRCERKWKKSGSEEDKREYIKQKSSVNRLIQDAKVKYYREKLYDCDDKGVFQVVNTLLQRNVRPLPVCSSPQELCDRFATYFTDKVSNIRKDLDEDVAESKTYVSVVQNQCTSTLTDFQEISEEDVVKLIAKCPNKMCYLDVIPTWLLKEHIDVFSPIITRIINASLSTGSFPRSLGQAVITPILKKPSLDKNDLSNYRPVSNITFVSKLIEKVVTSQLSEYLHDNNLSEMYQSAYMPNTSTETALMRVKSDILAAMNKQEAVLVVLLDLSAAFDTVDHCILLNRLQHRFGVSGNALNWTRSYLANRSTQVHIDGFYSQLAPLNFGLPQGSVIGPRGFTIYSHPLGDIIRMHKLRFHIYADDTQIYVSCDPKSDSAVHRAVHQLETCIADLRIWMKQNKLKLNDNKSEFFIAGTAQTLAKLPPLELKLGNTTIQPSDKIRNLGIIFDSHMSMSLQVNSLISSINYQLRNIRRISKYLDTDTKHKVVRSLILSRLDYGNALLYGASAKDLDRLQSLQHKAVKLIFSASRRDSPSPLMHNLHWLPVRERILFKICLYVYKCMHNKGPQYLSQDIIQKQKPSTGPLTRSANDSTLLVVQYAKNRIGDKSYTIAGPNLWNKLPRHIREASSVAVFKKMLKSHYYPY